ncbi:glycoside hydrolase [Hymenopellis radicata]|nr:glycoside hydrolase [Hymenopellis radicata]
MTFLKVSGAFITKDSVPIVLRGAGLGGWLTMENFITGYPSCEYQIRDALDEVLGPQKAAFFFDKFLENFFTESDALFFRSLGLNCIRIAVNYRHFEDDSNPRVLKADGFKHLDRVINLCAKHSIYTIIDMHTAPGGQSGGWHADGGTHIPLFWRHKDFQDRFPADPHPTMARLTELYDRLCVAIPAVDPNHIIFLDGNTFASDFAKVYVGSEDQKARMKATYVRKRKWMDDRGLCVWNGEWGPVYARRMYDGDATDRINDARYMVLRDQLELYSKDTLGWSIWLYKDIGFQGMVYVSPDTAYMTRFKDFLAKKHRLAVDAWGADDKHVKHVYDPIVEHIREAVPDESKRKLYPPIWSLEDRVTRITRTILVAEYLVAEWADIFRGLDEEALEELAKSFHFDNCVKREGLNEVLRNNAP